VTVQTRAGALRAGRFDHVGLLYRGRDDYAAATVGFVREGLAAGEPVLVAVPRARLDLVRGALGDDAAHVRFLDMAVAGRNPGRIIPEVLWAFATTHPDSRVRMIGEPIWPGRSVIEYPACAGHELAINAVFAGSDVAILCPYDAAGLDAAMVADAARTHPWLSDGVDLDASPHYSEPVGVATPFNRPLPAPPAVAATMAYSREGMLHRVRRFVAGHAVAAGLSPDRVDDLCLAINELAANTCEHTDLPGRLSIWTEPGLLVCQVDDRGFIDNPLAGRIPPAPGSHGGRGLLMVHSMCDLVRVHTGPDGTTIRVHMDR
jgi:anti-sigma regulatory factor (Ser/Thr protein kinase)